MAFFFLRFLLLFWLFSVALSQVATTVVSVALKVVASAPPTDDNAASLKTSVVTALAVAEDTVKNFLVAVADAARRLLPSADGVRRALTTTYEWDVSFTVTADLSNETMNLTEPTDFGTSVKIIYKTNAYPCPGREAQAIRHVSRRLFFEQHSFFVRVCHMCACL